MFQELRSISYSELIEQNVDVLSCFSPNGLNFAYAIQGQLIVLDVECQKPVQKFICDSPINCLGWSPDSDFVHCCMKKQGIIQIWNLSNPVWRCKIKENPLAVTDIYWAPDSRHLLVVLEFHLKITVWSLVSSTTAVIENPKSIKNCISFSHCGRYMAVAERRKCEDFLSIYTCNTWEILKFFPLETKDLSGIYFSPSNLDIGVLENYTEEPKVIFYSIDGRILGKYVEFCMFGFTSFSWSPNGTFFAVGDYFGVVTVLDSSNCEKIMSYSKTESVNFEKTTVYKINSKSIEQEASGDISSNMESFHVLNGKTLALGSLEDHSEKNRSKFGIKTVSFSHCGKYLLSINDSFPKVLFVFDLCSRMLSSVILHHSKIKDVSWHQNNSLLAICCGSQNLDLWTPTCCISLSSPFRGECPIVSAEWCPKKSCMLLNGKKHFTILYLPEERDSCK